VNEGGFLKRLSFFWTSFDIKRQDKLFKLDILEIRKINQKDFSIRYKFVTQSQHIRFEEKEKKAARRESAFKGVLFLFRNDTR